MLINAKQSKETQWYSYTTHKKCNLIASQLCICDTKFIPVKITVSSVQSYAQSKNSFRENYLLLSAAADT